MNKVHSNDELWDTITPLKLSDVAAVTSGKRLPKGYQLQNECTKYNQKYLRVTDMTNFDENELMYVPDEVVDKIKKYRIFENDIYISVAGTLGVVGKITKELSGINLTENANRISNFQGDIDFLLQYLQSPKIKNIIDAEQTAAAQPKLALERIRNFPIPNIEYNRQVKIGKLLSLIDDLIEESSKLEELYTLQKNSYMQNVFDIKSNFIDKSWKLNYLGDIFEIITDYVAAGSFADVKKNVTYRSDPDHAMLVRCTDLKSKFTSKEFVYVDKHAYDFLYRVNIDEDCIVLPNIGNIGESYFCNRDVLPYKHNILGPNTIMVRSKKNNNKFLYYITQTKQFRDELFKIAGGSGMLKFNKTDLKKIKIQIPIDYNEQEKISNVLSSFDELIDYQRAITSEYKKVKQYHLNNIFK